VEFETEQAFNDAYRNMHGKEIDEHNIIVEHERARTMPGE
jgi:hypothetical protein